MIFVFGSFMLNRLTRGKKFMKIISLAPEVV